MPRNAGRYKPANGARNAGTRPGIDLSWRVVAQVDPALRDSRCGAYRKNRQCCSLPHRNRHMRTAGMRVMRIVSQQEEESQERGEVRNKLGV